MENKQKINCEVSTCRHHDNSCASCKLGAITVTGTPASPTAHYCREYQNNLQF